MRLVVLNTAPKALQSRDRKGAASRPQRLLTLCLALATLSTLGAEVLDRIAVVIGKRILKTSDIRREMRITAFLNGEPFIDNTETRRKAAERLIDQAIIRDQIERGGYAAPTEADSDLFLQQMRQDRFGGSAPALKQELARYNLSDDELRKHIRWQLSVLRFIDQRFRPAVIVSDEQVRQYYDSHLADLRRRYPEKHSFDDLKDHVRDVLEGERVNQNFERWLDETRKKTEVEYKAEAFR